MNEIRKIPFLRLLLPLLAGIVAQYYLSIHSRSIILISAGIFIMLLSYIISTFKQYNFRYLFGLGLYLVLFSIGVFSTFFRQQQSVMLYSEAHDVYQGTIVDLPKQKPNTIALKVLLKNPDRQILCFLPKDSSSRKLKVGEGLTFFAHIEPFTSVARSGEFDYAHYMYNQGYAGFTFVDSDKWEKSPADYWSLGILASKSRQLILNFYKSLQLTDTEYGILAGLSLGYKDALPDDLIQSFRNTGTAHILAVSGLHIAVIYEVLLILLSFLPRRLKHSWLKQILIIGLLWAYAFIVGLPSSAVRACLMLTFLCIAEKYRVKGYAYNTLFGTAFCMLVWNPFRLFDLGFQLSFTAILAIRLLMPLFSKIIVVKNRCLRYVTNLFWLSIAVQLGIFPLCLYYFGTFPSYFFIANLLILPCLSLAVYDAVAILLTGTIGLILPQVGYYISYAPIWIFKIIAKTITSITHFFETLPYALFTNLNIYFWQIFVLWILLASFIYFGVKKKPRSLMTSLACLFVLIVSGIVSRYENKNTLTVHNNHGQSEIFYQCGYKDFYLSGKDSSQLITLNNQKYLLVKDDHWQGKQSAKKFDVDYLHLEADKSVSLYSLSQLFNIKKVILGSSVPQNTAKRYILECEKLRIPYYQVLDNGMLRINF